MHRLRGLERENSRATVPGNLGNGGQWYDNAPAGWKTRTPQAWDAAVVPGNPGHVAFVESVNTDGTITVSEYNRDARGNGGTRTGVPATMGFTEFVDFGVHPKVETPAPISDVRVPMSADFNGDGREDLLTSSKRGDTAPNLITFLSSGSWLGGGNLWSSPGDIRWADAKLSAGDLDGDGKSDLFAIQSQSDGHPDIYWLKSQGASFASPQLVGVPGLWSNDVKTWESADFTGEGRADLLAVSKRGDAAPNFVVFPSTGNWLGAGGLWGAPGVLKWADVMVIPVDLDGDGKTDLLAAQPDNDGHPDIYWSRSTGSSFDTPQLVGVPGLNFGDINNWASGDFSGDGYQDLLATSKRGDNAPNLVVFPSLGGWLGGGSVWGAPGQLSWANQKIVPADLDGDGRTDLLSVQPDENGHPNIYWSRSEGSSFAAPQLVGVPGLAFGDQHWQR